MWFGFGACHSCLRTKAGYNLDKSPVHHRDNNERQTSCDKDIVTSLEPHTVGILGGTYSCIPAIIAQWVCGKNTPYFSVNWVILFHFILNSYQCVFFLFEDDNEQVLEEGLCAVIYVNKTTPLLCNLSHFVFFL